MIVFVMTMMMMIMVMVIMRMAARISTAQRTENCRYIRDCCTKPLKHSLYDMVAKNEDTITLDLGREVTVADMPGEFGNMQRITPADFVKFLACGADFNLASVIEDKPVTVFQHHRLCEIDEYLLAAFQNNGFAPQMTFITFENGMARRHGIDHLIRTNNGSGTKHFFAFQDQNMK